MFDFPWEDDGDNDAPEPQRVRIAESLRDLEQACCQETHRLVRPRMLGGVGGAPGNRAPIPIVVIQLLGVRFERYIHCP